MAKSSIRYVENRYKDFLNILESNTFTVDSGNILMIIAGNIKQINDRIIKDIPICYLRDTISYLEDRYLSEYKHESENTINKDRFVALYKVFYLKELIHAFSILLIKKKTFEYTTLESMYKVLRCSLN